MLLLDPESGIHTDRKQGNPKQGIAYVVGTDDDPSFCGNRSDLDSLRERERGLDVDKEGSL